MDMNRAALLSSTLVLLAACGDRPQRVGKEDAAAAPAPAQPAPASVRFAGKVFLVGGESAAPGSAVFVSARRKGQTLPALSHRYTLSDPAWSTVEGMRVLAFELTDADNMGGFGSPLGAEMEIQARYDPDGMIDPAPGAPDPGVVKAVVPASPGDKAIEVKLELGSGQ